MTTASEVGGASGGPSATFPFVIRTRATTLEAKSAPRNENASLPSSAGTLSFWRVAFAASKNSIVVVLATSTSLKAGRKPRTSAGVVDPGTKKVTSTTFEPTAVNRRGALNGAKEPG